MEKIIVAKAIVKALEGEGVKVVFGHPGEAILPLYNELRNSSILVFLITFLASMTFLFCKGA